MKQVFTQNRKWGHLRLFLSVNMIFVFTFMLMMGFYIHGGVDRFCHNYDVGNCCFINSYDWVSYSQFF